MSRFPWAVLIGCWCTCFVALRAADAPVPLLELEKSFPLPALLAHATAKKIPLNGIDVPNPARPATNGDSLTALIQVRDGSRARQWLASFEIAAPTAKESATARKETIVMNIGARKHTFSTTGTRPLEIQTVGPFIDGLKQAAVEKHARTLISPDFLALGLDRACDMFLTLEKTETKTVVTLPEADERIFAGLAPALTGFFQALQETPALKEILWEIVDLPSAWSMLKRGGKVEPGFNITGFARANPADWGLVNLACYRMNLSLTLNGQPALDCAFFVTAPHPPLLTSAGIVGIVASRPGRPDKRVDIRVLSAQAAAVAAATAP